MIIVEFRLICSSSTDGDQFIAKIEMPEVPLVGEVVNIDGEPYVVHDRGWGLNSKTGAIGPWWAYLRCCSLQSTRGVVRSTAT